MRSFLGIPILLRGEAWGNLYLTEKEGGGGPFDASDEGNRGLAGRLGRDRDRQRPPVPIRGAAPA